MRGPATIAAAPVRRPNGRPTFRVNRKRLVREPPTLASVAVIRRARKRRGRFGRQSTINDAVGFGRS